MTEKNEIVLDVKINTQQVAVNLAKATEQVRILKQEQKLLDKALAEGTIAEEDYGKAIAQSKAEMEKASREIKSSTALLQAETIARIDDTSSLDDMRQALNAAQKAYAQLSGDEKKAADSAGGLREQIAALSDKVKQQEAAIGDARRNVGNYAMRTAEAAGKMGFFGKGLAGVVNPLKNVTMGLKAASATPFLAIVSLLITLLQKLAERFKGNAAAMEKLTSLFGAFSGIGTMINKVIDSLADGIGWLAEKMLNLADALGLVSAEMKASQKIAEGELQIEKDRQQLALMAAQDQKKVSDLRAKIADKEKHSASERIKMLQEVRDTEEEVARRQYVLAQREYELQVKKSAQSRSSQEELKKENELKIAMLNAEIALDDKRRELNEQESALRKEQIEEERKAAQVRLEIRRSVEDAMIALDTDAVSRQVNQLRVQGEREVENLKIKLNQLKKTDLQARAELGKLIVAREEQTQREITAVLERAADQRAQALRNNAYTEQELLTRDTLQLAQFRYNQAEQEFTRILSLTEEQQNILYGTKEAYDAAVLAADKQMSDAQLAVLQETYAQKQLLEQNEYERQLANIQEGDSVALANAELAQAEAQRDALLNMDEATKAALYSSQLEYEADMIQSEKRVTAAKKKAVDEQRKMAMMNAQSISSAMDALSGLLDQFGEENAAAAKASKVLALGKVAVDTGVAIAGGVAQAQSVPFPANIAAIATTIATVIANMATAISTIKSAKFADGGIVGGTSYTGDQVTARVNSREMILPLDDQKRLFDAITGNGDGTLGMNYEMLAATLAALPAPVLDYSEFTDFQNNVATYNEIAAV